MGDALVSGTSDACGRCGSDPDAGEEKPIRLGVLGTVTLTVFGRSVALGASGQRLLVLMALKGGQINRLRAAGLLWPDVTGARANANLRSVLWRLQRCCCEVVVSTVADIRFTSEVAVDIRPVHLLARQLLDRSGALDRKRLKQALDCNFSDDLAPEFEDWEWLEVERERHRQLRLHALEALSENLIAAGWYGAAVDAALRAINADQFRESAHSLLVKAHLAEGNLLEARRRHAAYGEMLRRELGIDPSERFARLLQQGPSRQPRAVPRQAAAVASYAQRRTS